MIPYGRQNIAEEDVEAVVQILRSDFLTQGPAVPRFEAGVAAKVGATHAIAVNSATSALHLACLALDLGKGEVLWTSPNTFVATANCALYCGADVDFVDIDPRTLNMCPRALEKKLKAARADGRLPSIVVPVHFSGEPCDMPMIGQLAREYGFRIIEDASHAVGALCNGKPVGGCAESDITVFSFHPVKVITSGEGGMAVTNDKNLADRMAMLRSHGITRDPERMTNPPEGEWYYQQIGLGFNYRLTDIQAALGLSQLSRLDLFIARRHQIADRYDRLLADLPIVKPERNPSHRSAMHLYVIRVPPQNTGLSHPEIFRRLRDEGIGVNVHYIPVHLQPHYTARGFTRGQFPHAESYYTEAISLPMFPDLTDAMQDRVVTALREALAP